MDQNGFRKAGTRPMILVPLIAGGTILGSLSCGVLRAERTWTDTQAQWLRFLGEIFAHVLLRQRAGQALRHSEALSGAVRVRRAGASGYLRKPFDQGALIDAIGMAVSQYPLGRQGA